jgi:hypothetical protein
MFISNGGNVGIGTATPLARTHIYHTGAGDILRVDDETAPDSTPFMINLNGSVGIGTSTPIGKLHIDGGNVHVVHEGAVSLSVGRNALTTDTGGSNVRIAYAFTASQFTTSAAIGDGVIRVDDVNKKLHLLAGNGGAPLTITSANVGIGTTTPIAKTHIYHTGTGDILRVDDETAPDNTPLIVAADGNIGI